MTELYRIAPIGVIECVYKEKFATPRQASLVRSATGRIRMLPPFNDLDAFDGIESSSHLWVHFIFNQNRHHRWQPKVRPPRLGGNKSTGVFATRSPYRPNAIGLSLVCFDGIEQTHGELYLHYLGGDMIDGTPVIDIKPYLPYADCVPQASNDLADKAPPIYPVTFSASSEAQCLTLGGKSLRHLLVDVLSLDPRPSYHSIDPERSYVSKIDNCCVRWRVTVGDDFQKSIIVDAITNNLP